MLSLSANYSDMNSRMCRSETKAHKQTVLPGNSGASCYKQILANKQQACFVKSNLN